MNEPIALHASQTPDSCSPPVLVSTDRNDFTVPIFIGC